MCPFGRQSNFIRLLSNKINFCFRQCDSVLKCHSLRFVFQVDGILNQLIHKKNIKKKQKTIFIKLIALYSRRRRHGWSASSRCLLVFDNARRLGHQLWSRSVQFGLWLWNAFMEKADRSVPEWRSEWRLSGPFAKFMDRYIGGGCIAFLRQKYTIRYRESDQTVIARVRLHSSATSISFRFFFFKIFDSSLQWHSTLAIDSMWHSRNASLVVHLSHDAVHVEIVVDVQRLDVWVTWKGQVYLHNN